MTVRYEHELLPMVEGFCQRIIDKHLELQIALEIELQQKASTINSIRTLFHPTALKKIERLVEKFVQKVGKDIVDQTLMLCYAGIDDDTFIDECDLDDDYLSIIPMVQTLQIQMFSADLYDWLFERRGIVGSSVFNIDFPEYIFSDDLPKFLASLDLGFKLREATRQMEIEHEFVRHDFRYQYSKAKQVLVYFH
jgi:hypothetical protein